MYEKIIQRRKSTRFISFMQFFAPFFYLYICEITFSTSKHYIWFTIIK